MTEVATVSPKGQVTIPKAFRDELEIKPGDRVFFIKTEDGIAIFKPKKSLEDYRGFLRGREGVAVEPDPAGGGKFRGDAVSPERDTVIARPADFTGPVRV